MDNEGMFSNLYVTIRVLQHRYWAFSEGSGGFRELREAGRNHFHLSWCLADAVVTSYGPNPWGGFVFTEYGMSQIVNGMW